MIFVVRNQFSGTALNVVNPCRDPRWRNQAPRTDVGLKTSSEVDMYELSGCNLEVDNLVFENSIPGKWEIDFNSNCTSFIHLFAKQNWVFFVHNVIHINHVCVLHVHVHAC